MDPNKHKRFAFVISMLLSSLFVDTRIALNVIDGFRSTVNEEELSVPTSSEDEIEDPTKVSDTTMPIDRLSLPSWTTLPSTQFTENVLEIVSDLDFQQVSGCDHVFHLKAMKNSDSTEIQPPHIQCEGQLSNANDRLWCLTLRRIFESRTIPFNVSIGFVLSDRLEFQTNNRSNGHGRGLGGCIGSSSPGGRLVMPNMEEIREMLRMENARESEPEQYRWAFPVDIPWEKRHRIPIFRGSAWASPNHDDISFCTSQLRSSRFQAVAFSKDYPNLLDARFSRIDKLTKECFDRNDTHLFTRLLPVERIRHPDYFSKYQVALVLAGIGAAFRTSVHFMTTTTVILQDFYYQEWFTKYLKPFVHYIPLAEDLNNLNETLHWVQQHPAQVMEIGRNGRAFWEEHLTFQQNEEHIYELVYRLSEYTNYIASME